MGPKNGLKNDPNKTNLAHLGKLIFGKIPENGLYSTFHFHIMEVCKKFPFLDFIDIPKFRQSKDNSYV